MIEMMLRSNGFRLRKGTYTRTAMALAAGVQMRFDLTLRNGEESGRLVVTQLVDQGEDKVLLDKQDTDEEIASDAIALAHRVSSS